MPALEVRCAAVGLGPQVRAPVLPLPFLRLRPRLGELSACPLGQVADGGDGRRAGPVAPAPATAPAQALNRAGVDVAEAAEGPLLRAAPEVLPRAVPMTFGLPRPVGAPFLSGVPRTPTPAAPEGEAIAAEVRGEMGAFQLPLGCGRPTPIVEAEAARLVRAPMGGHGPSEAAGVRGDPVRDGPPGAR